MNVCLALILGLCISLSYTYENVRMKPRLTQLNPGDCTVALPNKQPNAMFYLDNPDSLYIGGEEVVYHYDFSTWKEYPIKAEKYSCRGKDFCRNFVTYVTRNDGYLMACGTNAYSPACWKLDGENFEKISSSWDGQLSPRYPGLNYNILKTGSETYSTIPKQSNNGASTKKATFRKLFGKEPLRFTGGDLLKNPLFVKSLVVEGEEEMQNRIFLFFMDDNSERRTTDKRVPMIARMCKEEKGSEKPDERYMFSTALKSRLICGNQEGQYYNFLQDIYFLESQDLIYGLFTNPWNHSAVCSYKTEDIELVFSTSDLFGSTKKDLKIRPGQCRSELTPQETAEEAGNHPELVDWIWPSKNKTVFQTLDYYRKLVVDEITVVNKEISRVIIVATDDGILHKIVEQVDGAMNVLEMKPFNNMSKILFLDLDLNNREQRVLYVGSAQEFSKVRLDDCRAYNKSCSDCVLSKDPYCGWFGGECQSILNNSTGPLHDLTSEALCEQKSETLPQRGSMSPPLTENKVLPPSVFYITCPAESKQATYWWTYGDNLMESCTPHNGKCDLIFDKIKAPGEYRCMEKEEGRKQRLVSEFKFSMENSSSRMRHSWLVALVIIPVCINIV
ncbi:semaphorin-7A [Rana temporaria]|uniref:semaphorin-7A n=1 Tax=Rana temporaria TaxID=8407 RepID=UPI001AADC316|nr:semaphorin-7A [Rana temporaria]